jgi:RNA polymerase sigma-70 factor (ECF subfamily)
MQSELDIALMKRAGLGDGGARREVVLRLLPRAQRLCRSLLREPEDAKDASQSSIVEILKSAGSYRGDCSLERWADRIVVRTALSWVARERRKRMAPSQLNPAVTNPGAHDARLLALEYLEKLPEKQGTVLLLRCAFDYSVDEIAELIGISRNSVKDRLLRARAAVRQMLRDEPGMDLLSSSEQDEKTVPRDRVEFTPMTGRKNAVDFVPRDRRTR